MTGGTKRAAPARASIGVEGRGRRQADRTLPSFFGTLGARSEGRPPSEGHVCRRTGAAPPFEAALGPPSDLPLMATHLLRIAVLVSRRRPRAAAGQPLAEDRLREMPAARPGLPRSAPGKRAPGASSRTARLTIATLSRPRRRHLQSSVRPAGEMPWSQDGGSTTLAHLLTRSQRRYADHHAPKLLPPAGPRIRNHHNLAR